MFFKQQYAVNSRVRFQFVILKITTLLLNSRVSTTAKLPISLHTDCTQYLLYKYFNLIFPSIFLQVAAPPHSSFNISTLKFPQRLYLLKLQVGPEGLCLLFFPDKTPNSNGKNDHRWSSFLALKFD